MHFQVLGRKGEERFPDLDAVGVTKKHLHKAFHSDNRDFLHNCGDAECQDDYKGWFVYFYRL